MHFSTGEGYSTNPQKDMFRNMRPDAQQAYQAQMVRNMQQQGGMAGMKGNLARAAMANNQK